MEDKISPLRPRCSSELAQQLKRKTVLFSSSSFDSEIPEHPSTSTPLRGRTNSTNIGRRYVLELFGPLAQLAEGSAARRSRWGNALPCLGVLALVLALRCAPATPESEASTSPTSMSKAYVCCLGSCQLALCFFLAKYLGLAGILVVNHLNGNSGISGLDRLFYTWAGELTALLEWLPRLVSLVICILCLGAEEAGLISQFWPHSESRPAILRIMALLIFLHVLSMGQAVAELCYGTHILRAEESELWQNAFERRMHWLLMFAGGVFPDHGKSETLLPSALRKPICLAGKADTDADSVAIALGTTFEHVCSELVTFEAGQMGSKLWSMLGGLDDANSQQDGAPDANANEVVTEKPSRFLRPSVGASFESSHRAPRHLVERGSQLLFRRLAHATDDGGALQKHMMAEAVIDPDELEHVWGLLQALEAPEVSFQRRQSCANISATVDSDFPRGGLKRSVSTIDESEEAKDFVHEEAFVAFTMSTFDETRRLIDFVDNNSSIFGLLTSTLKVIRLVLFTIAVLHVFFPEWLNTLSWLFSSVILTCSFAFGPTMREAMESLVLLLHIKPFDAGDRIKFCGVTLIVVEVRLLSTVFQNVSNEVVYIRNASLYAEASGIVNLRRSGPAACSVELLLLNCCVQQHLIDSLMKFARSYVAMRPMSWSDEPVTFGNYPDAATSEGVTAAIDMMGNEMVVRWRVCPTHRLSKHHSSRVTMDTTRFLHALVEEGTRLGICWSPCELPGRVLKS